MHRRVWTLGKGDELTLFAAIFCIATIVYVFVLNLVLTNISGSLKDELKRQGILIEANSDMAEMTNSTFWNQVRMVNLTKPNPAIRRALRKRAVLYSFGAFPAILFLLATWFRI